MFDPTAFDNMKVVIEGALYDLDLNEEIIITDRNDLLNIAKMSRLFTISFKLPKSTGTQITALFEMEATLNNLAGELLPGTHLKELAGCYVKLQFSLEAINEKTEFQKIEAIFRKIWGEKRKIGQSVEYNPLEHSKKMKNMVTVDFDRMVSEAQMDDLVEMVDFMVATLQELEACVSCWE